jgi:uncharacterized protein YodC (DUF2158 family)
MIKPGDIAVLRSGGQPMTVVAVEGEEARCMWMSEEGELYRESIPLLALERLEEEDEDEEDDDDDEADDDTGN